MKKFSFSKSKGVIFPFFGPKGIVLESENIFLLGRKEGRKMILGCLSDDYSLVVQYSLVEER